jgi:hypothetical protein
VPSIADYLQYFGPATKQITMTNTAGNTIPATSTSLGSDAIRFDWLAFGTKFRTSLETTTSKLVESICKTIP